MTVQRTRLLALNVFAGCLMLGLGISRAWADMGRLVLAEQQGDTRISVFISPEPLRAGPIDISVLLQDAETGEPIDDAEVNVKVSSGDVGGRALHAVATRQAATNKLLRAALLELPSPGSWEVEIDYVANRNPARQVRFTIDAGPLLAPWLTVWPWFSWPAAAILLYGVHRWLVARRLVNAATANSTNSGLTNSLGELDWHAIDGATHLK